MIQTGGGQEILDERAMRIKHLMDEERWEEAIPLIRQAMDENEKKADWKSFSSNAFLLATALSGLKHFDACSEILENSLQKLEKATQNNTSEAASLFNFLALSHARAERFSRALEAYEKAIAIFKNQNILGAKPAYACRNAAQIFVRREDYTRAILYFEASLLADTSGKYRAATYAQMANCYHYLGDEQAVMKYCSLGFAAPNLIPDIRADLKAIVHSAYEHQGRTGKAILALREALAIYPREEKYVRERIRAYTALASISARQNRYSVAEQYFQKAEAEGKFFYKGKSREMAKLYIETGFFYEKTNRPEHALAFYQKALVQSFPNFNSLNISENPSLGDAWLESQAMRAAAAKALVLTKNKDAGSLLNAAHCFDLSFAVATQLRRTYGDDADKLALAANNRQNYNAAALNLWQLWRENNDPLILARLFAFLEQTKAQALGDALQQQRALALAELPDTLLAREENLRIDIAGLVGNLKTKEEKGDSAGIVLLKERLFRQEKTYHDFLETLKTQYPQFRQFTQAYITADLPIIQASLPDTTALLSWFDAGDRYLCVVMRRHHLTAFEVSRDSFLDGKLSGFFNALADKNSQQANPEAYFSDAYFLFKKLLPDTSLAAVRSLIIIPDGSLCYLPFEALLTAKHQGSFASAPYLLRSITVQYAWAATLLTLPPLKTNREKGLLQIAPFVESARDGLATLSGSLSDIPESLRTSALVGANATADLFLKKSPRFNIIHLSTHADAGSRETPGIELYDRRLTLPEIYSQRFHASLVSLSACETGKGRFTKGEGVLSLARAFAYAGAQSIVASHWSVNERSTAELFSAFYKNLGKGLPKAEALRQAKLNYLFSSELDARKAPFHWAAFTLTGSDGPVDFGANHLMKWLLGIIALVVMAFLFRWFYFFKTGKITPEL
ncbi:MAG: hypothetical protein OHK0019_20700 [Saprospiraceae bacterium]